MADTLSKEDRSKLMRQVKSHGNRSTEIRLLKFFKQYKIIGWRRKFDLYGKPDFVFPAQRLAVFVDGCFWHGHNCRNTSPSSNENFWLKKFAWNKERDLKVNSILKKKGWKVVRVWECTLRYNPLKSINRIKNYYNKKVKTG